MQIVLCSLFAISVGLLWKWDVNIEDEGGEEVKRVYVDLWQCSSSSIIIIFIIGTPKLPRTLTDLDFLPPLHFCLIFDSDEQKHSH